MKTAICNGQLAGVTPERIASALPEDGESRALSKRLVK
jgi:hypothetical protein